MTEFSKGSEWSMEEQDVTSEVKPQVKTMYAGFWIRLLAFILDAIALFSLNMIVRFIAGQPLDSPPFGFLFIEFLYMLVYYVGMTTAYGQTLGKMILGIRVIRTEPDHSSQLGTMLYRELFGKFLSIVTLGIGFLLAGWSREHRALHDMIADTQVIIEEVEQELDDERESA
jgi:uncharacterized RDD family membrane protein YckC